MNEQMGWMAKLNTIQSATINTKVINKNFENYLIIILNQKMYVTQNTAGIRVPFMINYIFI